MPVTRKIIHFMIRGCIRILYIHEALILSIMHGVIYYKKKKIVPPIIIFIWTYLTIATFSCCN